MFKSKTRSIIIPQYEHGRMAGTLASLWGNAEFDKPEIDFKAFIKGVTLHDWHYGRVDDVGIGQSSEVEWLAMVQRGVEISFDDPVTDIVAKNHIHRLLSGHSSVEVDRLLIQLEEIITKRFLETEFTQDEFAWADKITAFCDMVAFDFSFEKTIKRVMVVCPKAGSMDEIEIRYEVKSSGKVLISPWPFFVESIQGIVIGYQEEGYPDVLNPEIIEFDVSMS